MWKGRRWDCPVELRRTLCLHHVPVAVTLHPWGVTFDTQSPCSQLFFPSLHYQPSILSCPIICLFSVEYPPWILVLSVDHRSRLCKGKKDRKISEVKSYVSAKFRQLLLLWIDLELSVQIHDWLVVFPINSINYYCHKYNSVFHFRTRNKDKFVQVLSISTILNLSGKEPCSWKIMKVDAKLKCVLWTFNQRSVSKMLHIVWIYVALCTTGTNVSRNIWSANQEI